MSRKQTLNDAIHYITKVTNAVWGLRPSGVEADGYLGDETHQVAFIIWARIVKYREAWCANCHALDRRASKVQCQYQKSHPAMSESQPPAISVAGGL
jgi:hypothetical protein